MIRGLFPTPDTTGVAVIFGGFLPRAVAPRWLRPCRSMSGGAVLLTLIFGAAACTTATTTYGAEPMLAHNVFFSLKEDSPNSRQALVAGCQKYLSQHPGIVFFAAGVVADDLQREVNDRDFDVALHVVFENMAAHNQYQQAENHLKFVEEFKANWEKVRVFDSVVER